MCTKLIIVHAQTAKSCTAGSSSRVLDALSGCLSLILKYYDTKLRENIVDQNLDGACTCCAQPEPVLYQVV